MTKTRFLVITIIFTVLVGGSFIAKADTLTEDYKARLIGHGTWPLGDMVIAAVRTKNGGVQGVSVTPQNWNAAVTEIVPPTSSGYWCVNVAISETHDLIWFVKDVVNGVDEVAYTENTELTCATAPTPAFFTQLTDGDFKTELKTF
ncbi:MAG: hypothetical protein HYT12_02610 [Candidatus Liptonbacteria bacterium]|nr:hypothetical protein [Candidatus Liptonbacteria bacterium]